MSGEQNSGKQSRIDVEINGVHYSIKSDTAPEKIILISQHVDEQLRLVMRRNPRLSLYEAAVLVALNIAGELFNLREEYDNLTSILEPERK